MEERLVIKSKEEALLALARLEMAEEAKENLLRKIEERLPKSPNGVEIRRVTPFEKTPAAKKLD